MPRSSLRSEPPCRGSRALGTFRGGTCRGSSRAKPDPYVPTHPSPDPPAREVRPCRRRDGASSRGAEDWAWQTAFRIRSAPTACRADVVGHAGPRRPPAIPGRSSGCRRCGVLDPVAGHRRFRTRRCSRRIVSRPRRRPCYLLVPALFTGCGNRARSPSRCPGYTVERGVASVWPNRGGGGRAESYRIRSR
jgi:hypothetical protein